MKNHPVHENLDTSFVNLSALVKYLRRRQFAGHVRIELSGYEADIYLTAENELRVREYDQIAGRVADGAEALQRILIRARDPGGIINVYQTIGETETDAERKSSAIAAVQQAPEIVAEQKTSVQTSFVKNKPPVGDANAKPQIETALSRHDSHAKDAPPAEKPPTTIFPNVPFEFSNKVEARAKQTALSAEDREMLLNLTGELLGTLDRTLATAKLDFPSAFQKACAEIAADYPFLKTLDYDKGKIHYRDAQMNPKFFVAGVLEAVRRILDRLAAHTKFAEAYRAAVQRVLALIHQRRPFYDRFSMTEPLEKILGA